MSKQLFDTIRTIKGSALSQADVDAINLALGLHGEIGIPISTGNDAHALTIKHLRREEGVIPYAYQDHLGFWTIGVGRLIDKRKGGRLTDPEIDMLLINDVSRFEKAMADWPAWQKIKDDPVRSTALLSMCFQMGEAGLAGFKNSLALVAAGKFKEAAANMLQSAWAKQTPERAKRVTQMIATGVYQ